MKKIYIIRQIIVSLVVTIILICAFFQNAFWGKIIIVPFLICAFAILGENLFLLLNKIKISNIFKYVFKASLFIYIFGFLSYMVYYAIINKSYFLFIVVVLFLLFTINFFKMAFFNKK